MGLDRQRLSQYVGIDATFEAQYLALLKSTVSDCITELRAPTTNLYSLLHASKPGIVVASTVDVSDLLAQVCDTSAHQTQAPISANNQQLLEELANLLVDMRAEIDVVLGVTA